MGFSISFLPENKRYGKFYCSIETATVDETTERGAINTG